MEAKGALEKGNVEELRQAEEKLNSAAHKVAEAAYAAVGSPTDEAGGFASHPPSTPQSNPRDADDVIDADFQEVKRAS